MFCSHLKITFTSNLGLNSQVSAENQMIIKCVISTSKSTMLQALLGKHKMSMQNLLLEVSFFMGQEGNLYHMCQQEAWLSYLLPFQSSE